MRRENLAVGILVLPTANALALANFQQITSTSIPLTCLLAYNSQIPACTTSDFNSACSSTCQSALLLTGEGVKASCLSVSAGSTTLLGIIMNGGIIQALCPKVTITTTIATSKASVAPTAVPVLSSSAVAGSSQASIPTIPVPNPSLDPTSKSAAPVTSIRSSATVPPAASVTIRTSSTNVVVPPASTRASSAASSSFTPPQSQISGSRTLPLSVSTKSVSTPAVAASPTVSTKASTSSTSSTTNGDGGDDADSTTQPGSATTVNSPPGKTTASSATTTSAAGSPATPTNKVTAGGDTGGGSPFDSQSSKGNHLDGSSALCALVIAVWATVMFGR